MAVRTAPPRALHTPTMPVQAKLAAAWTSLMFLVIYIDYFHLYLPDVIDGLRDGVVYKFDISPGVMTAFFVVIAIPALMVVMSIALPAKANRTTNLVVAAVYIPVMVFNISGSPSGWIFYYVLTISVELLLLACILRSAWTWPRVTTGTGPATADLRR